MTNKLKLLLIISAGVLLIYPIWSVLTVTIQWYSKLPYETSAMLALTVVGLGEWVLWMASPVQKYAIVSWLKRRASLLNPRAIVVYIGVWIGFCTVYAMGVTIVNHIQQREITSLGTLSRFWKTVYYTGIGPAAILTAVGLTALAWFIYQIIYWLFKGKLK